MKYRKLGNTGLLVGEIALGCEGFADKERAQMCDELSYAMQRAAELFGE